MRVQKDTVPKTLKTCLCESIVLSSCFGVMYVAVNAHSFPRLKATSGFNKAFDKKQTYNPLTMLSG